MRCYVMPCSATLCYARHLLRRELARVVDVLLRELVELAEQDEHGHLRSAVQVSVAGSVMGARGVCAW